MTAGSVHSDWSTGRWGVARVCARIVHIHSMRSVDQDAPLPGPGELTADFLADLAFKLAMKQAEMKADLSNCALL